MSKDISVLIVDDEEFIRELLSNFLSTRYRCYTAASVEEAREMMETIPFNLIITDINMPGVSGLTLCKLVKNLEKDTVVIVASGMTNINYAIESMQQGAFDYIVKPFDLSAVLLTVERAIKFQMLIEAKHHYEDSLEETIRVRTEELRLLNESLNNTLEELYNNYRATLRALANTLEARDVESRGHSDRVVAYCLRLGKEMNLSNNDLIALEQGALLHDIGKMGLPDHLLMKTGAFSNEERNLMREHIERGLLIINNIDFLKGARPVVGQHHEKFDGSGYPNQLKGEEIHLHARIFAVADAFDAITSDRPYRAARSYSFARAEIVGNTRTHFDPKVVNSFLQITEWEWEDIRREAGSKNYVENFIDRRDIRSFIISLKRHSGNTGALNPNVLAQSGLLTSLNLN